MNEVTDIKELSNDSLFGHFKNPNANGLNKRRLYLEYERFFRKIPDVKKMTEQEKYRVNYWFQVLLLDNLVSNCRTSVFCATNERLIIIKSLRNLLHSLEDLRSCPRTLLLVAENFIKRMVCIPSRGLLA